MPEALLAKGFLESGGFECFLAEETTVRRSNPIGSIPLYVSCEDLEAADQILSEAIPE
jgi:hypothetical protein